MLYLIIQREDELALTVANKRSRQMIEFYDTSIDIQRSKSKEHIIYYFLNLQLIQIKWK